MSARPLVLGLDLCGTVGDHWAAFAPYVAADVGVDVASLPAPEHWDFTLNNVGIRSGKHYLQVHAAAVRGGMYRDMPYLPHAVEVLTRLAARGVHIRVITSRLVADGTYGGAVADTAAFLDAGPVPYRDLCMVEDKTSVTYDVLLDDGPHNVVAARALERNVIVFDQAYNRHLEGPRARDWLEVEQMVLALLVEHERAQALVPVG